MVLQTQQLALQAQEAARLAAQNQNHQLALQPMGQEQQMQVAAQAGIVPIRVAQYENLQLGAQEGIQEIITTFPIGILPIGRFPLKKTTHFIN